MTGAVTSAEIEEEGTPCWLLRLLPRKTLAMSYVCYMYCFIILFSSLYNALQPRFLCPRRDSLREHGPVLHVTSKAGRMLYLLTLLIGHEVGRSVDKLSRYGSYFAAERDSAQHTAEEKAIYESICCQQRRVGARERAGRRSAKAARRRLVRGAKCD